MRLSGFFKGTPTGGVVFGRHSKTLTYRCQLSLCIPHQACITSALTQGRDAKRPCPKCKKFNVGLDDLVLVGKGVESSSSSSEAGGSSSSGYRAKSEPRKGSGEDHARPNFAPPWTNM